jgi:hypothetical protein
VWNSSDSGDNQTADIAAHPAVDGLVLTGHEGFVLRTTNNGFNFDQVLTSPSRFFLDWDRRNPDRAYAAGSPNFPQEARAYVSRDLGQTWSSITGALAPLSVQGLVADATRLGVVYAATSDGVYRFFGGGAPLCLDSRAGIDQILIDPGPCTAVPSGSMSGDVIVGDLGRVRRAGEEIDLGEVECVIDDGDVDVADLDIPDPPSGEVLFLLVRLTGSDDYGTGSGTLLRLPSLNDCSPDAH